MFKQLYLALVIFVIAISAVQAESYIRDYTYKASDIDSKVTSRTNALDQVKLLLLQEIGTHIRQKIHMSQDGAGNSYASEDIEAITAGLTKVEILNEKWNGETYYLEAKIDADTTRVLNALKEFKNEKTEESEQQLAALKENQRKLKETREEVAELKRQLAQANNSQKEGIVIKYAKKIEQISLSDMFSKAYGFQKQGKYEDAVYWYRKAAEQGHAGAQSNLGVKYGNGQGVKQSYATAVKWFRKAAEQGDAYAQFNLGLSYDKGQGVKKNYKQAVVFYRKAAEQGYANAQFHLGRMYHDGQGVNKNYATAVKWYRKAAEQGHHAYAQSFLGGMYHDGEGVNKNYATAVKWYRKAAEQGNASAQYYLGNMYRDGKGVNKNYTKAVTWYRKAAEQRYLPAQFNLDDMYSNGQGVK